MAIAFLSGCGSASDKDDEELKPSPLLPLNAEIGMQRIWGRLLSSQRDLIISGLDLAYADGDLYAVSTEGMLYSLSDERGQLNWSVNIGKKVGGGVGYYDGQVYAGTFDGNVVAFDSDDGQQLWATALGGEVLAVPVSNGEIVVVHTLDGKVFALDATNGKQRWVFASNMPVLTMRGCGRPIFAGNLIIVGLANGKLVALDYETGQVRWERHVAVAQGRSEIERIVDIDATPLLSNGLVYAVSYQGRIVAFEASSGRPFWREDESSFLDMAEGFGNIYVTGAEGSITAYNKQNGSIRWEQSDLVRRQVSAPVILGSYIAVSDFEGYIHLLSQVDGRIVARRQVDEEGIATKMLVHGNTLYAYTNGGKLVAYATSENIDAGYLNADMPARMEIMQKRGMHQDVRQ